ncbi:hypothetical protein [Acidipila sp. EB88]|uniref:hypothetical protein n=1 Tax=Acidipila sp. EB88 TaxID=2305226 RepID=UPI000F5E1B0A|nr:hypothetical protein [Acidipila sp. EB88]RRA47871.1 hypothetical protein D1Y84_05740 [Acidipila sp. EB88]
MNAHLNDEAFAALLAGEQVESATHHLTLCAHCRQELTSARLALGQLRIASIDWSEAQQFARPVAPAQSPGMAWRMPRFALAGIALAVLIPSAWFAHLEQREAAQRTAATLADHTRDDQLLNAVRRELAEEVAPSMQPLMIDQTATQPEDAPSQQE